MVTAFVVFLAMAIVAQVAVNAGIRSGSDASGILAVILVIAGLSASAWVGIVRGRTREWVYSLPHVPALAFLGFLLGQASAGEEAEGLVAGAFAGIAVVIFIRAFEAAIERRIGVMICYRRDDSAYAAGWLAQSLNSTRQVGRVFIDVDEVPGGTSAREAIRDAIDKSGALLVLVGRHWLDGHRVFEDADYVRFEIEYAREKGVPILPVFLSKSEPLLEDRLPPSIRFLAKSNRETLRPGPDFDHDVRKLAKKIRLASDRRTAQKRTPTRSRRRPPSSASPPT